MAALPYVGSKISLISKSEIRYEGTLHKIDKENQTVSLINVRSFGTEGRRTDLHIKPKPTPFNLVVFRGQDIKDLNVQQAPAEDDNTFQDPAIVSHEDAAPSAEPAEDQRPPAAGEAAPPAGSASAAAAAPAPAPAAPVNTAASSAKTLAEAKKAAAQARRKKKQGELKAKQAAAAAAAAKAGPKPPEAAGDMAVKAKGVGADEWATRTSGGRFHPTRLNNRWKPEPNQGHMHQHPHRGGPNRANSFGRGRNGPTAADAAIDIAATSAALELEKQKFQEESSQVDEGPKYDPNNFFDNLGSSNTSADKNATPANSAAPGPSANNGRSRRHNEHALNRETFGAVVVVQHNRRPNPPQNRRFHPQPIGNHYNRNKGFQGSHNRYGAHNRVGHHQYQRNQGQQRRGQQQRGAF